MYMDMEAPAPPTVDPPPGEDAYFATLIAGLEEIAADELRERIPDATVLGAVRGRLFFSRSDPAREALNLLTIEHLHAYVDQFHGISSQRAGLECIEERMAEIDLDGAVRLHACLHPSPRRPSFRITAKRAGEHEYNSVEISAAAGAGVVQRYSWDVDLEEYDYDVRVYVKNDTALVGLRLSPEALSRRARILHTAASLNPTVAHAMCRISEPQESEVVLDPMCGAGTILIERNRLAGPGILLGGDLHANPVEIARKNLAAAELTCALVQWDARRLPLVRRSVDAVICNLPWGRRIGSHRANRHLYPAFVRELSRVLRPGGRAVLLTQEKRLLTRLVRGSDALTMMRQLSLSLSGMHPTIYVVTREDNT